MRYFISSFLAIAIAIASDSLLGAARAQPVQDAIEVVIVNGPNAGTYMTPSDETICMHNKEMSFHAVTWRDLDNNPKKLSIANIQVANSDRPGPKLFASGRRQHSWRSEEDDVVGPLPNDLRVFHRIGGRAEHGEALVADLVAVAVRAVQHVARPSVGEAGDVGEFVAEAAGHQEPAGGDPLPIGNRE